MDGAVHDDKTAHFQQGAKTLVCRWLLSIDPHHKYSRGAEQVDKPIERRLKRAQRAPPPVDECNVNTGWLAGRAAAIASRCRADIAAASQVHQNLHTLSSGLNDAVLGPCTIIGSIIQSPVVTVNEAITSPVFFNLAIGGLPRPEWHNEAARPSVRRSFRSSRMP